MGDFPPTKMPLHTFITLSLACPYCSLILDKQADDKASLQQRPFGQDDESNQRPKSQNCNYYCTLQH